MWLAGRIEQGTKLGRPTMLTHEHENKLVDYACNRASMGTGFGRRQFLKYAGDLASKHNVKFKRGLPSSRRWRGIRKWHERLALRQPAGTAAECI